MCIRDSDASCSRCACAAVGELEAKVLVKVLRAMLESGALSFPTIEHEYNSELGSIFTPQQHKTLVAWAQRNADTIRDIQSHNMGQPPAPEPPPPPPPGAQHAASPPGAAPPDALDAPPLAAAPAMPMPPAAPPAGVQLRQPEPPAFFFAEGGLGGEDD